MMENSESKKDNSPLHFKGKSAIGHVAEAQAQGILSAAEAHGAEIPGHFSAAADAARESAVVFLLLGILLAHLNISFNSTLSILMGFSLGWIVWKFGRSAWLGWSRLERLHRIVTQEKWEIDHHRSQERAELSELYAAKGFEGKLLEDVIDVLMADSDRLLRVMVEEELGLTLESHEHPLKQGLGACLGSVVAVLMCLLGLWLYPTFGLLIMALLVIGLAAAFSAKLSENRLIPAVVWNVGLAILAYCAVVFFLDYLFGQG